MGRKISDILDPAFEALDLVRTMQLRPMLPGKVRQTTTSFWELAMGLASLGTLGPVRSATPHHGWLAASGKCRGDEGHITVA
jgi:hypothetical protein